MLSANDAAAQAAILILYESLTEIGDRDFSPLEAALLARGFLMPRAQDAALTPITAVTTEFGQKWLSCLMAETDPRCVAQALLEIASVYERMSLVSTRLSNVLRHKMARTATRLFERAAALDA